jgi:hypothetical protein
MYRCPPSGLPTLGPSESANQRTVCAGEHVAGKSGLYVERAGDLDAAERIARQPDIFVEQLGPRLGAGADREIDDTLVR